jgi:hypothetical protein
VTLNINEPQHDSIQYKNLIAVMLSVGFLNVILNVLILSVVQAVATQNNFFSAQGGQEPRHEKFSWA